MEWVSVEDRLPAEGDRVLVWDSEEEAVEVVCYGQAIEGRWSFYREFDEYTAYYTVTHWMPELEPPGTEKQILDTPG